MLCTNPMPCADDAALEQAECALNGIGIELVAHILSLAVIDGLVRSEHASAFHGGFVCGEIIRHYHVHIFGDVLFDVSRQRSGLNIVSVEDSSLATALPDANDNFLLSATPETAALDSTLGFATHVGFIYFDNTAELFFAAFNRTHGHADSMAQEPCGLVADTEHPLELVC